MARPHRLRLVVAGILVTIGVLGMTGCSQDDGESGANGTTSTEENMTAADAVAATVEAQVPGSQVSVNYRNDVTVPATLAITVRVDDAQTALDAVAEQAIPTGTVLDDAERPLAPIAAVAAQAAWQSPLDPLKSLAIDVVPGGDPAAGDSWNLGITGTDTVTAFDEAFGTRP